ncbi:MAG: hypothetical protein QXF82_04120 [Nitrososphaeria archaeon]
MKKNIQYFVQWSASDSDFQCGYVSDDYVLCNYFDNVRSKPYCKYYTLISDLMADVSKLQEDFPDMIFVLMSTFDRRIIVNDRICAVLS